MSTVSTTPGPSAIGADDKELPPGLDVGEYRIEQVIGRGGFGTVYGAVQPVIGKRVAIKVLARKYAADQDIVSRFAAEARAVNQIRHRNIIDIFSFGQLADGRHYYVMEYLDGEPLDSYLRRHGPMTLDEALPILRGVARALDAAHAKGIAHRDLKPENIFLAEDPDEGAFPKLLDFGIAKLLGPEDQAMHRTGTGVPIGTPYFMSPEQCRGRDVDHRTDIYSFGVVCYRLLTGAYPFEGDFMELLFKQVNEEPAPPTTVNRELPASVDTAIAWMMQKDRDKRPKALLEAVNALDPDHALRLTPMPRSSRASVSGRGPAKTPSQLALAETGISSPNALAATQVSATGQSAPAAQTAQTAPASPSKARPFLWASVIVVIAVVASGAYLKAHKKTPVITVESHEQGSAQAQVAPPPEPPKPAAVVPDAAPAAPETVVITLTGAPDGAQVLRDGKLIGIVPKLSVSYSTKEQYLVVQADGYQPLPVTVVPDQDRSVPVTMKKKTTRPPPTHTIPPPRHQPNPDDVEDPFKTKQ